MAVPRRWAFGVSRGRDSKVAKGWKLGEFALALGSCDGELRILRDNVAVLGVRLKRELDPVIETRVDGFELRSGSIKLSHAFVGGLDPQNITEAQDGFMREVCGCEGGRRRLCSSYVCSLRLHRLGKMLT